MHAERTISYNKISKLSTFRTVQKNPEKPPVFSGHPAVF